MSTQPAFTIKDRVLHHEQTLVEMECPILTVCIDNKGTRYLAHCFDMPYATYFVCQISDIDLVRYLTGSLHLKNIFKHSPNIWGIIQSERLEEDSVVSVKYAELAEYGYVLEPTYYSIPNDEVRAYLERLMVEDAPSKTSLFK